MFGRLISYLFLVYKLVIRAKPNIPCLTNTPILPFSASLIKPSFRDKIANFIRNMGLNRSTKLPKQEESTISEDHWTFAGDHRSIAGKYDENW